MFDGQFNKENKNSCNGFIQVDWNNEKRTSTSQSIMSNKQSTNQDFLIIINDDDDSIEIEEISEEQNAPILPNLIPKLDQDTELIFVQPNSSIRICASALVYSNLLDTHIILVNHSVIPSPECHPKRQLYLSKSDPRCVIPIRTRIYHRLSSLLGFVFQRPSIDNHNRYLILFDDYTAAYHHSIDFHLCLCQNFVKHLSNIDYSDLRTYYQNVFQQSSMSNASNWSIGTIIRVRKFGTQYHNVRIIDRDCSIIKICFFERKSQTEIWIHSNSSMIDPVMNVPLAQTFRLSSSSSSSSSTTTVNSIEDIIISDGHFSRLRKRKNHVNNRIEGRKKLRDRSNSKSIELYQRQSSSSSSSDDTISSASRANMLTVYYTNILRPKFDILNHLPYIVHKCNEECVRSAEENISLDRISMNPFLLPFQCQWSIIDGRPRGYRTPCRRTLYTLDDIENYLFRTKSKLSIKFFIDDLVTRFAPTLDAFNSKYILNNDLSHGLEKSVISVYNDVDNDQPDRFTYITQNRPFDHRISAALNDTNSTSCCDCLDNCSDRMKCACFRKTLDQALLNQDPLVMEKQKSRYSLSYIMKSIAYQRKRLLHPVSSGIYECNSKCSCHRQHCTNRLIQHGLFVQLQLFKDKSKGWGLRTLHDLPRGTFICQYMGELITSDQGHERAQTMDDRYQTSLDLVKQIYYDTDIDDDDDDDDEPYVIDGSLFGNLGKYFNHSCEPNMYIQNVFIESHDLHFPNLALFTHTRVKAGEELTWHYNCELLPDRQVKCYCGSKNCRGRLL